MNTGIMKHHKKYTLTFTESFTQTPKIQKYPMKTSLKQITY